MKRLLVACLLAFSATAFADVQTKAECNTASDYNYYQARAITRIVSYERDGNDFTLQVEVLQCAKNKDGYAFERLSSFGSTRVETNNRLGNGNRVLKIERSDLNLVAYNSKNQVIARAVADQLANNTFELNFTVAEEDMDATSKGGRFELSLYTLSKIFDDNSGELIDSGREVLGAYALTVE